MELIKVTVIARSEATKQSPDPSPIVDKFKPPFRGVGGYFYGVTISVLSLLI